MLCLLMHYNMSLVYAIIWSYYMLIRAIVELWWLVEGQPDVSNADCAVILWGRSNRNLRERVCCIVHNYGMKLWGMVWDEPKQFHFVIRICVDTLYMRITKHVLIILCACCIMISHVSLLYAGRVCVPRQGKNAYDCLMTRLSMLGWVACLCL